MHLFPEIGLEEHKFRVSGAENLESLNMRRKFLLDFAHSNDFDALIAENWYSCAGDISAAEVCYKRNKKKRISLRFLLQFKRN